MAMDQQDLPLPLADLEDLGIPMMTAREEWRGRVRLDAMTLGGVPARAVEFAERLTATTRASPDSAADIVRGFLERGQPLPPLARLEADRNYTILATVVDGLGKVLGGTWVRQQIRLFEVVEDRSRILHYVAALDEEMARGIAVGNRLTDPRVWRRPSVWMAGKLERARAERIEFDDGANLWAMFSRVASAGFVGEVGRFAPA